VKQKHADEDCRGLTKTFLRVMGKLLVHHLSHADTGWYMAA
jgi:condensin complex subunit 1